MASPLEQFKITPITELNIGGFDASFTNSALWMLISAGAIVAFLVLGGGGRADERPGRMRSMAEMLYSFVSSLVRDNAGAKASRLFPFVFALFVFVLVGNLMGMIPGAFTFTSHIIVTAGLATLVFVVVTALALYKHGLHFFTFFVPEGCPALLYPLLIPVEIISYLLRPVSLSVRLFANMLAGHTMIKVFAGFIVGLAGAFGGLGYIVGVAPFAMIVALIGLEILVACLQAYVFAVLTCLYIKDALELH